MKRALLCVLLFSSLASAQDYDLLIRNGRMVDGAGNPWVYADVGVIGDRIAFIGQADPAIAAKRILDVKGLVVAPGFIDMLDQSEVPLLIEPQAVSKLSQGITTLVTGEGDSVAPLDQRLAREREEAFRPQGIAVDWTTLDGYFRRLEKQGIGVNLGTFVGATQVRRLVIGDADRAPTPAELARMREVVGDAMYDGALGVSSSLVYAPAIYAGTDELVALAKEAAKSGGIYATHIRNEADSELPALEEAFRIGREAGIPVEIWHLKVAGRQNWSKMPQVIAAVEKARSQGVDVTADQYPYLAAATSLSSVIPPKYHDGGSDALVARLRDPQQRAAIRKDLAGPHSDFENWLLDSGGPGGILVTEVLEPELRRFQGKTIAQIAASEHKDALDALMDLVIADRDHTGAAYFMMSEPDLRLAMQQPWVAVDTDAASTSPTGPFAYAQPHPRAYGTFPRILGKYVREEHILTLENAIRKMTSLAAQRVKLADRGLLRPGYFADITIFDPATVIDTATFEDPHQLSRGIEYVLVNGVIALDHGKLTGQLGGRPLRGPGWGARSVSADGLPPRGKIEGVVTDEAGWPVPRASISLLDSAGRVVGSYATRKDGRYEIVSTAPCASCRLRVERDGFSSDSFYPVDYNGANSLWFSFALKQTPSQPKTQD